MTNFMTFVLITTVLFGLMLVALAVSSLMWRWG